VTYRLWYYATLTRMEPEPEQNCQECLTDELKPENVAPIHYQSRLFVDSQVCHCFTILKLIPPQTNIHCVHEKNCNVYCIRCHINSSKQRRILTKFYANTETSNCKQVTKFQQNRSTSATATASLVRSLKSTSVGGTGVIDCHLSVRANGKTSAHPSVFEMFTVCSKSNASSKMWTPLSDRFIDDHLLDMFPLFDQARLQLVDVTNLAAVRRYTRSCNFHQIC